MNKIQKSISDLGVAAYILMKEYKVIGRQAKYIYFEVDSEKEQKFDDLKLEYLSSELHRFDSCLMSLKKTDETKGEPKGNKYVTDLGAAAYLLMHKFRMTARKGKIIYFEINEEEFKQFDEISIEYLNSCFHHFDSCLMSLKKINETFFNRL